MFEVHFSFILNPDIKFDNFYSSFTNYRNEILSLCLYIFLKCLTLLKYSVDIVIL